MISVRERMKKREELIDMKSKKQTGTILEKLLKDELNKVSIHFKQLEYSMDFGNTEVAIKFGLN